METETTTLEYLNEGRSLSITNTGVRRKEEIPNPKEHDCELQNQMQ